MQTRTAAAAITITLALGVGGAAAASTRHHDRQRAFTNSSCTLTPDTASALRTIAASDTPAHAGANVSYPALKADADLAAQTLAAHGC